MEQEHTITLSPEAATAIQELMDHEQMAGHALRVYIAGAG